MSKTFLVWALVLTFIHLSCGSEVAFGPGTAPTLTVTAPAPVIYTCIPITVTSSTATTAASALSVTLGGAGAGQFFSSLDNCRSGTATTTLALPPGGATSITGYYLTKSTAAVELTATIGGVTGKLVLTPASLSVLGQDSTSSLDVTTLGASRLIDPHNVTSDGTRLFVVDQDNNRVLGWNSLPTADGQPADFALGQAPGANNLTTNVSGASPTASTMVDPVAVDIVGGKLFVGEKTCRILVWNTIPTGGGQPADFVLGQPDPTGTGCNTTAVTLNDPHAITSDGTRLFVADNANCRVLVWNTIPTASGAAADYALGQAPGPSNLDDGDCSGGSGSRFSYPADVVTAGGKLFVLDDQRLLVWNSTPTAPGVDADFALGQAAGGTNLTANDPNQGGLTPTAATLSFPDGMATDGTRLLVADGQNNRVLVWDTLPTAAGQPADRVFGQPGFTSNGVDNPTRAEGLGTVQGIFTDGVRFLVTDTTNRRVRIFPLF